MNQKQFDAILAKNNIARELRGYAKGEPISLSFMQACFADIELYIGQGNQPSALDILNCKDFDL